MKEETEAITEIVVIEESLVENNKETTEEKKEEIECVVQDNLTILEQKTEEVNTQELQEQQLPERKIQQTTSRSKKLSMREGNVIKEQKESEKEIKEQQVEQITEERIIEFIRPLIGGQISSNYGYRGKELHTGVDTAIAMNSEIFASASGVVSFVGWSGGYGKLVIIDHENGYQTYYAHCNAFNVELEQEVAQGDVIAFVGTTGRSTGYHLHFEIRQNGQILNPNNYISF